MVLIAQHACPDARYALLDREADIRPCLLSNCGSFERPANCALVCFIAPLDDDNCSLTSGLGGEVNAGEFEKRVSGV